MKLKVAFFSLFVSLIVGAELPSEWGGSRWGVMYSDAVLGPIVGEAVFDKDAQSASVILNDPETDRPTYELESESIAVEENKVTIVLNGESPFSEIVERENREGARRMNIPLGINTLQLRAEDEIRDVPFKRRGSADFRKVTLELTMDEEKKNLSGEWFYKADIMTERDAAGRGRVGTFSMLNEEKAIGEQRGPEIWTRKQTEILAVIVINNQLGQTYTGPSYRFKRDAGDEHRSEHRTLMIFGRNLPKRWSEVREIASTQAGVTYRLEHFPDDGRQYPHIQSDFDRGWEKLLKGVADEHKTVMRKFDFLTVRASLAHFVNPGTKDIKLNDSGANWPYRFGDNIGTISFVREVYDDEYESITNLFIPERIRIMVETDLELDYNTIDFKMLKNREEGILEESEVLSAKRDGKNGEKYRYLSPWFAMHQNKADAPETSVEGEPVVKALVGDKFMLATKDPAMLNAPPVEVEIVGGPARLGPMWKDAMKRAADCHGIEIDDFATAGGKEVETLSTIIFLQLEQVELSIKLQDQAAMILLRDAFLEMSEQHKSKMAEMKTAAQRDAFIKQMGPLMYNENFPLARAKVTGPDGEPTDFRTVFLPEFVQNHYELTPEQARKWCYDVREEGFKTFLNSMQKSMDYAENLGDCDVEGLLRLTGLSFQSVSDYLQPRLMKLTEVGTPPRLRWVPDRPARAAVNSLRILGDAFKAQEDYSSTDSQQLMIYAAALTLPAMAFGGPGWSAVMLAADVADAALVAGSEVWHWRNQDRELEFAEGATHITGTGRLDAAEAGRTSTLMRAVTVAGAVIGPLAGVSDLRHAIKDAPLEAVRRAGTKMVPELEEGGMAALRAMSDQEKVTFSAYLNDVYQTLAKHGPEALTSEQRRMYLMVDKWRKQGEAAGEAVETLARTASDLPVPRPPDLGTASRASETAGEPTTAARTGDAAETASDAGRVAREEPGGMVDRLNDASRGGDEAVDTTRRTADTTTDAERTGEAAAETARRGDEVADGGRRATGETAAEVERISEGTDATRRGINATAETGRPASAANDTWRVADDVEGAAVDASRGRRAGRSSEVVGSGRAGSTGLSRRPVRRRTDPFGDAPTSTRRSAAVAETVTDTGRRTPRPKVAAPPKRAGSPDFNPAPRPQPVPRRPRSASQLNTANRAVSDKLKSAEKVVERIKKTGDSRAVAAAKDAATDLKQRKNLLDDLLKRAPDEEPPRISTDDMDWLSGVRRTLSETEAAEARQFIMDDFGGDWGRITKAFSHGEVDPIFMHKLVTYRKQMVDSILDDIIKNAENAYGVKVERKAFGSANLTSDYDLSIVGKGAEMVVGAFNRRFRKMFKGRESGSIFDTNVYTDPVYELFGASSTIAKKLDVPPNQLDAARQFIYEQMAMAKYMDEAQWNQHMKLIEAALPEDAVPAFKRLMKEAENADRGARRMLAKKMRELEKAGFDPDDANTLMRANNEIYEQLLGRIHRLRNVAEDVESMAQGAENFVRLPKYLKDSPFAAEVEKLKNILDTASRTGGNEGRALRREARKLKEKLKAQVASQLRNHQGNALYFASEAYQTAGTIRHVVADIQATGRKVTETTLAQRPPVKPKLTVGEYLNSLGENRANMFKELNNLRKRSDAGEMLDVFKDGDKAAGKAAKYLIRQLDAARQAGVHLPDLFDELPGFGRRIIDATVQVDDIRSDLSKIASVLKKHKLSPDEYAKLAMKASDKLTEATAAKSPLLASTKKLNRYYNDLDNRMARIPGIETPLLPPKIAGSPDIAKIAGTPDAPLPEMERIRKTLPADTGKLLSTAAEMQRNGKKPDELLAYNTQLVNRQTELSDMVRSARASGIPDDDIRHAIGNPHAFRANPMEARVDALRRIETLVAQKNGIELIADGPAQEMTALVSRIQNGTASAADSARLSQAIKNYAQQGKNFFEELPKMGSLTRDRGFHRILPDEAIDNLHDFAVSNNLISHTDMPLLRSGNPFAGAPVASRGTPPQLYNDTCGLMVVQGMKRDAGLTDDLTETALRTKAVQENVFTEGVGMTRDELASWIRAEGASYAEIAKRPVSLSDIRKQVDDGKMVATMINTAPPGAIPSYHWVRVEGFTKAPDGRAWVSIGDPASGKSWRQPADLFYGQMEKTDVVVADFRRVMAEAPAPPLRPRPMDLPHGGATGELPSVPEIIRNPFGEGNLTVGDSFASGKNFDVHFINEEVPAVVKIARRGDGGETGEARTVEEIVRSVQQSSEQLEKAGIPHLKVYKTDPDSPNPYVVQESVGSKDRQIYTEQDAKYATRESLIQEGRWSDDHDKAIAELFDKIASNNLVWTDPHLANIYFESVDGKLIAGIIDTDRIGKFDDLPNYLQSWRERFEMLPNQANILSNVPSRQLNLKEHVAHLRSTEFKDARQFMAKMLESKRFVNYSDGTFTPGLINPESLQGKFNLSSYLPAVNQ